MAPEHLLVLPNRLHPLAAWVELVLDSVQWQVAQCKHNMKNTLSKYIALAICTLVTAIGLPLVLTNHVSGQAGVGPNGSRLNDWRGVTNVEDTITWPTGTVITLGSGGSQTFTGSGTLVLPTNITEPALLTFTNVTVSGTLAENGTVQTGTGGTPHTAIFTGTGALSSGSLVLAIPGVATSSTVVVTASGTTAGNPALSGSITGSGTLTVLSGSAADARTFNYAIFGPH